MTARPSIHNNGEHTYEKIESREAKKQSEEWERAFFYDVCVVHCEGAF